MPRFNSAHRPMYRYRQTMTAMDEPTFAVFRNGVWYLQQSPSGFAAIQFGLANDQPVPAAYLP